MARTLVCWLGVTMGVLFLPVLTEAGEQRLQVSSHKFVTASPSFGASQLGNVRRNVADPPSPRAMAWQGVNAGTGGTQWTNHRTELATLTFAKTTATTTTDSRGQTVKEQERNETPGKRQTITFFRFTNSKLGEVSVQPVVGNGVNGAQLSIGF
ncbi:MAG: hypothetical protein ACJ8NS_07410 [Chthoniobacterales bacterium]